MPIICKFDGTVKGSPEGNVAVNLPSLLSSSINAINSPNTREMFALLISSKIITCGTLSMLFRSRV